MPWYARLTLAVVVLTLTGVAPALQSQGSATFHRYDAAAIGAPRTIVSADFNRDGFPDVAVGGTTRASVGILMHHGAEDGDEGQRFKPLRERVVGGGPFELAAADLNKDGLIDIAVANADADAITILFNDPTHQFNTIVHLPFAGNPRGIAIADFNRDGNPDIVGTKYMAATVDVLYGAGDGTFPSTRSFPAPPNAQGVTTGDFNRDGWTDAVTVSVSGLASFYYMSGTGAQREDVPLETNFHVVTAGDFDRNGWTDIAAASTSSSVVQILLRTSGGWQPGPPPIPVAASPRGIETADLNRDGTLEIVAAGRASSMVSVLTRNGDGSYTDSQIAAGSGSRDVALADFSRDGRTDVLTANEFGNSVTVLGNTHEAPGVAAWAFDEQVVPTNVASAVYGVADFNQNGKLDIVRDNHVLLDGTTQTPQIGRWRTSAGAVADFNGDGRMDIVYTHEAHPVRGVRVFFGNGSGGFADGPISELGGVPRILRTADMNRDGIVDLVAAVNGLEVGRGLGDGRFVWTRHAVAGPDFELGDLDRDGIIDAVVSTWPGIQTLLGNGDGTLRSTATFRSDTVFYGIALGDTTGDGVLDVAAAIATVGSVGPTQSTKFIVGRGNGDGSFEQIEELDTAEPGIISEPIDDVVLGDLDGDSQLDLFTSRGHLYRGGGAFTGPERFAFIGRSMLADVTGDGLPDVLGVVRAFTMPQQEVILINRWSAPSANRPPEGPMMPDRVERRYATWFDFLDEDGFWLDGMFDRDMHALRFQWKLADGRVVSNHWSWAPGPDMIAGEYAVTITVDDYRGGVTTDTFTLVMKPHNEMVLHPYHNSDIFGAWRVVEDATAAQGRRVWHPNANAPKLQTPLATPTDYIDIGFLADPTQEYKLWIRLKADDDHWANDSVFVQFTGSTDSAGNPVYRLGTTAALAVNLEECSGCGVSGWGWEDDGWGAVNQNGTTIRFPDGGRQILRIQTREDGVSIDQIILSGERFRTTRPGAAKDDATKYNTTGPDMGTWWFPWK